MATRAVRLAITAALWAVLSGPAVAQQCGERSAVLAQLASDHREAPVAAGLEARGGVVELLATRDGETWTLILSLPNGLACVIAAGEAWQTVAIRKGRGS